EPLARPRQLALLRQREAEIVLRLLMVGREVEGGLEAADGVGGGVRCQEDEAEVDPQRRIGRMVLDQRPVDLLGLGQLAELEERQPEEVSRTLVARLVAKRLLQRDPRLGGVAALERLGAGGERAVE